LISTAFLAPRVGASDRRLRELGDQVQAGELVRERHIRKRSGGTRTIVIAAPILQEVLKKLLRVLYTLPGEPHPSANGFVPRTSTRRNAANHLAQPEVLHLDLADYFGTVSASHLDYVFSQFDLNDDAKSVVGKLVHTPLGLPQGFATSPYLATLALKPLDEACERIALGGRANYSRYADDLTFSGENLLALAPEVLVSANDLGWQVNGTKTRLQKRGSRQYVSGLTVTDYKRPRLPRKLKRRYRSKLHKIETLGYENFYRLEGREEDRTRRLMGMMNYMNSIEPEFAGPMLRRLEFLLPEDMPGRGDPMYEEDWDWL